MRLLFVAALLGAASMALSQRSPAAIEAADRLLIMPPAQRSQAMRSLRNNATSQDLDCLVEIIGRGSPEVSREATELIGEVLEDVLRPRWQSIELQIESASSPDAKELLSRELSRSQDDSLRQSEILYYQVSPVIVRELYQAGPRLRVALLQSLAKKAQTDFAIEEDEIYFGPWCGSYDRSNEYVMNWAARMFPDECVAALGKGLWQGRAYMMTALQGFKSQELHSVLLTLAGDGNTMVRGTALLELGRFPGRDSERVVLAALVSNHPDTRAKAVVSCGTLSIKQSFDSLVALLADGHSVIRQMAAEALCLVDENRGALTLVDALARSKNASDRRIISSALSKTRTKSALPALRNLLARTEPRYRADVLGPLITIGKDDVRDIILEELKNPDEESQAILVKACDHLKLKEALPLLKKLPARKPGAWIDDFTQQVIKSLTAQGA